MLDHVEEAGRWRHVFDCLACLVLGRDTPEEGDICADNSCGFETDVGFVAAVFLESIGAGDDDDVAACSVSGLDGGLDST